MSLIKGNHGGLGGAGAPGGTLGSFFSSTIDNSVRLVGNSTAANSARLTQTFGTVDSNAHFTLNFWIKRSAIEGANPVSSARPLDIFTPRSGTSGSVLHEFQFGASGSYGAGDAFAITNTNNGTYILSTNNLFRDTSAWYNIHIQADLDNGTAGEKLKIFINGTEASYNADNRSSYTSMAGIAAGAWTIGDYYGYGYPIQSYLARWAYVDGSTLAASYFGEFKDGVWIPKALAGITWGSAGHLLEFGATGTSQNSSGIGADTSGETNHWAVANMAAHDVVPDSPSGKNWATMNPLMIGDGRVASGVVQSEGNLKVATNGFSTSSVGGTYSTIAIPKDKKIYCEVYEPNQAGDLWGAGVIIHNHVQNSTQLAGNGSIVYYNRSVMLNGSENDYGSSAGIGGLGVAKLAAGDVLGIAVDGATGKVWFHRNGTYFGAPQGHQSGAGTTGNPSAGSNEIGTVTNTTAINPSGEIFIFVTGNSSVDDLYVNFGQDSTFGGNKSAGSETDANGEGLFLYAVPTDYVCLHSGNMSDPAIGPGQSSQSDDHFNTVLYTGNGTARSITGVGFQADWLWFKNRNSTQHHNLFDSVRGNNKLLYTNLLNAEATTSHLTSFDSDGFTLGTNTSVNGNSKTFVTWCWKGGGSASTNTDGSGIDSSVSANTDAGFSVLTYTGTGNTSHTIGHGLGKTPAFVMSKSRDTGSGAFSYWFIKWNGLTSNNNLLLNFTGAQTNIATNYAGGGWSDFDSSNTTTIVPRIGYTGSSVDSVNKSGEDYVAWVFAQVEGFSAIGSFKGNGADDGPFVYTGFRPAWLWIKRVDAANDWHMMDDQRNPINVMDGLLFSNLSNAESSDAAYNRDFLSNGFKIRGSEAYVNASGGTFVYMAFAHSPYKFANAF